MRKLIGIFSLILILGLSVTLSAQTISTVYLNTPTGQHSVQKITYHDDASISMGTITISGSNRSELYNTTTFKNANMSTTYVNSTSSLSAPAPVKVKEYDYPVSSSTTLPSFNYSTGVEAGWPPMPYEK